MTAFAFEKEIPPGLTQVENLPSLPTVALELLRLTQDEESSIQDLAQCISNDPALAAEMLKLANSSLFSMGQEVTTLERATLVLGLKTVKLMSLSFSLASSVPRVESFDFEEFWHRSLTSAVSSRALSSLFGMGNGDEAFLCGLLQHFGKLVMAQVLGEEYDTVLQEASGWPDHDVETARLGFSSTDLCATLLKSWELPSLIYMAVGYAERPGELPDDVHEDVRDLVELLNTTSHVETVLCDDDKAHALNHLHQLASDRLGISEEEMEDFLVGLEDGVAETADLLSVALPEDLSHEDIINRARLQIVDMSLGTAADLRDARRRNEELEHQKRELASKATTDRLTGLPNRAAFDDFLESQVQSRLRGKAPRALGLILIDIDEFKVFNDTHGHQAGDEVLRRVAAVLERETRKGDLCARYGGEEFALVAPHTNTFGLKTLAERLRKTVEAEPIEYEGKSLRVTASFGAACVACLESSEDGNQLIRLADRFLYRAKQNGRNRCEVFSKIKFPGR